jgi:uridine kinase
MSSAEFTRPLTLIIDGPSGAGKTWLANYVSGQWRASRLLVLVHMDDLYPGWDGLSQATNFLETVVVPARARRKSFRWQRFDWEANALAEWSEVPAHADLIIEGCGSITQKTSAIADISVWINADDARRKEWALGRGGEDFESHWDLWDEQCERFRETHSPQRHASLVVRSTR